jgi:hypothetical protein
MIMNVLKCRIDSSQLHSSQDHRAYNSFVQKVPSEMRNGKKTYLKRAACPTSIQGRSSVSFNILPQFSLIEHNSNICPTESISPPTLQNSINQISSTFQDLSSGEFSVTFVSGGTLFRISHRRICRRDTSCLLGGARHDAYPLSAPSVEVSTSCQRVILVIPGCSRSYIFIFYFRFINSRIVFILGDFGRSVVCFQRFFLRLLFSSICRSIFLAYPARMETPRPSCNIVVGLGYLFRVVARTLVVVPIRPFAKKICMLLPLMCSRSQGYPFAL